MSVLSRSALITRLSSGNVRTRLEVVPLLDQGQIGKGSIDVRLGNEFVVLRRTYFPVLDVGQPQEMRSHVRQYQTKIYIRPGEPFILHPQEFVIGSTIEYLGFPADLMAYVIGRSSWGRLGLVIATATMVQPEYRGTITLELSNLGTVPIALYPLVRIAQLVVHSAK